jgi:hypothetical protein
MVVCCVLGRARCESSQLYAGTLGRLADVQTKCRRRRRTRNNSQRRPAHVSSTKHGTLAIGLFQIAVSPEIKQQGCLYIYLL